MLYYKISPLLRELINKSQISLGCIESCNKQLIALDEFELLLKKLNPEDLLKVKNLKKEAVYQTNSNIHVCDRNENEDDYAELDRLLEDKTRETFNKKTNPFQVDIDYQEVLRERKEKELYSSSSNSSKPEQENTLAFAYNMVTSLIFVALGSYYLGKYVLEWKDAHTYILTLIISIVVIFAESILLMMKLHKNNRDLYKSNGEKLKKTSFAYGFNKSYREKFKEFSERQKHKFSQNEKDESIPGKKKVD